jgi:hypothetical protein
VIEPSALRAAKANSSFAALAHDGSIKVWGNSDYGGANAPAGRGYTKIYSNEYAFAALEADGSIKVWGNSFSGGTSAPTDKGYTKIYCRQVRLHLHNLSYPTL